MLNRFRNLMAVLVITFNCVSCTNLWWQGNSRQGVSSSLVDFLYPNGDIPPKYDANTPNLKLPLTVGLAFVPATATNLEGLSEAHKLELLNKVKDAFEGKKFINQIVIIPDTYMRTAKGFTGVDQIARLYGLDIIALVSYDQVANVSDNKAAVLYWTIVGSYLIKGSASEAQTFVDTAIFDITSHKMLFRAPGVNTFERKSTLAEIDKESRRVREKSFELAMEDMTQNLDRELALFSERIKTDKSVQVTHRPGYGGGGSTDLMMLVFLGCLSCFQLLGARKRG